MILVGLFIINIIYIILLMMSNIEPVYKKCISICILLNIARAIHLWLSASFAFWHHVLAAAFMVSYKYFHFISAHFTNITIGRSFAFYTTHSLLYFLVIKTCTLILLYIYLSFFAIWKIYLFYYIMVI